jgi:hypothetical protein
VSLWKPLHPFVRFHTSSRSNTFSNLTRLPGTAIDEGFLYVKQAAGFKGCGNCL